jgi:signal transduction histidine kinase
MEIIELITESYPMMIATYLLFIILVALITLLIIKMKSSSELKKTNLKLKQEISNLDSQAKLIVQNDMELKIYQEEAEDKLTKLRLLRKLIGSSISTLDKKELFSKLDEEFINNLGFRKALLIMYNSNSVILNINFTDDEIQVFSKIIDPANKIMDKSVIITDKDLENNQQIKPLFRHLTFKDFMLAPITMGNKIQAILVFAKSTLASGITNAEKELLSIICLYLSQALDNIKLFESLYKAGEELESKVKEKTFALKKSLAEVQEINKRKTSFISGVSHELRTPLTSIKGFSSLLVAEKFGELPPKAKKRLERIDSNADKLVNMVNTLLDISRIESKRIEINIAPGDLVQIVRDVEELLTPQMEQKNIKFIRNIPDQLEVYLDKNLIERVFINIINNAIKFTPEGGTIKVSIHKEQNRCLVAISDTGYGMTKEDCQKIFGEFYRATNVTDRKITGSGLGLSLVKQIIDTHKQKIWVDSELNKGTTFYFTLKLV